MHNILLSMAGIAVLSIHALTPQASGQVAEPPIVGASGSDFGAAMVAGDVDGDGLVDHVIGAPGASALSAGGYVDVRLGNGTTRRLLPAAGDGRFGSSLAVGELDGAPGVEIVVGAPGSSSGSAGAHYVFSIAALDPVTGNWPWLYRQVGLAGDQLGTSVAVLPHPQLPGAGNVWAAGAPGGSVAPPPPPNPAAQPTIAPRAGYVDIHDPSTGAPILTVGPPNPTVITCPLFPSGTILRWAGSFSYGRHIVGGDFDGDGLGDLAGTYTYRFQCFADGASAGVIFGDAVNPLSFSPVGIGGVTSLDDNRIRLASVGDVDGNGGEEIAVAVAAGSTTNLSLASCAGQAATVLASWTAPGAASLVRVDGGGDVDGDGLRDVALHGRDGGNSGIVTWLAMTPTAIYELAEQPSGPDRVSSVLLADIGNDGWVDLSLGADTQDRAQVFTPNDPSLSLSVLGGTVSGSRDERIVYFLDGGLAGGAPGEAYGLLGSYTVGAVTPALTLYGQTLEIDWTSLTTNSSNNPTLLVDDNLIAPFDASGRFRTSKTIPSGAVPVSQPFTIFVEYVTYALPFNGTATGNSNAPAIQFVP